MDKKELLEASLEDKLKQTKRLIMDWYEQFNGNVYIAFSGGKDSTVLLHIARGLYPEIKAVYCNTGLEFPEINDFVRSIDNVVTLKPRMNFKQVLDKYGYPIVSKSVSMAISRYRNTKDPIQKRLRLHGGINPNTGKMQKMGVIPNKWKFLVSSDLKISDKCCDIFKKDPFKAYEKKNGSKPIIGTMASESNNRRINYLKEDCNGFKAKSPQSKPLSFWSESDIYKYIRDFGVEISSIYSMGYKRTGCMFCMYGLHLEKESNTRFDIMSKTHPKLFTYCMDKLGLRKVIKEYTGKEYNQPDLFNG